MLHVTRLDEHSEPALIDAQGQRHRLADLVTTIADLEEQHRIASNTPGPVGPAVARILEQSLARRYTLVYLLDGVPWPQRMGGHHESGN